MLATTARAQLVDATGLVLIDSAGGASPAATPSASAASSPSATALALAAGSSAGTLVRVGNYCGPAPVTPLSIAFVLPDGGRIVASPISPSDETVPACMGTPGSPGSIEMQPWAP